MPRYALGEQEPKIDPSAFVHPDAVLIGDVRVGPQSSIWPGAVLRGDRGAIIIGAQTSIQDGSVLHCTDELDTVVGDRCVVGHRVHMEGCTVEDDCLIGSGSVVLHRAVIRSGALVGAQALVTNDTEVPERAMALGVPAKIFPDRVPAGAHEPAMRVYVENADWYNRELRRID
ncbi:MAG: gamma carbonic anhydrase family protein [Actinomycetia bacterium]|nr:gamma carbonic anhydrase family protein [Actinomycetes bacterium]MCH9800220.1 gamma carbonic anhydrase family protein [Actinomycetes bacterium]